MKKFAITYWLRNKKTEGVVYINAESKKRAVERYFHIYAYAQNMRFLNIAECCSL